MSKLSEYANKVKGMYPRYQGTQPQYPYNTEMVKKSPLFNPAVTAQIEPKAPVEKPKVAPVVDTTNAIGSLAGILGPSPDEIEARERKAQAGKAKMQAWAGLFDGLRQLGNLYYASKGAVPQQYNDNPYQQVEGTYQQERQKVKELEDYRRQYAQQIYNLSRQKEQDQIQREAHQANMQYKKSQEEALREKSRREEEKNRAMIKRADAMAEGDHYKAAYWKAKAEGYNDEAAARIAKIEAEAEKSRKQGDAALINANKPRGGNSGKKRTISGYQMSGNDSGNSNTTGRGKAY